VLTTLADGQVLAAWLDRRGRTTGDHDTRLYARIVGEDSGHDVLIEAQVSEKSPPALVSFPDGSALLSYRTLGDGTVRDINVVRYRLGRWENDHNLSRDDWRSPHCPASGPQLAASGGRVAAAWFTAAEDRPRLRISSPSPIEIPHGLWIIHIALAAVTIRSPAMAMTEAIEAAKPSTKTVFFPANRLIAL
jgi:hypothetical protein